MLIENLKKMYVKNKILRNKEFYEALRKLDKSITDEEAYNIMLKILPENTELIKVKSESEFLQWITVESFETINRSLSIDGRKIVTPYKTYLQNIEVIRGDEFIQIGEIFTDLTGRIDLLSAKIDPNEKYIVIRENIDSNLSECKEFTYDYMYEEILYTYDEDLNTNAKYQIIVYDP